MVESIRDHWVIAVWLIVAGALVAWLIATGRR